MEFLMRLLIGGIFGGVACAVLWVVLFTLVFNWPSHEAFTTPVFVLGGFGTAILSLKGTMW